MSGALERFKQCIEERRLPYRIKHRLGNLHTLPDFIIIGGQKCGTTTMYDLICRHPNVHRADQKEMHFFSTGYERGVGWYRARFPLHLRRVIAARCGTPWITGEATPNYLNCATRIGPEVPERVRQLVPNTKLIVLLRDPVDRAYSQGRMNKRRGIEDKSFDEAIHAKPTYLAHGTYARHLKVWKQYFYTDQFHIIQSEIFRQATQDVLSNAYNSLELPSHKLQDYSPTYQSGSRAPMSQKVESELISYYDTHNKELEELVERTFNSWKSL